MAQVETARDGTTQTPILSYAPVPTATTTEQTTEDPIAHGARRGDERAVGTRRGVRRSFRLTPPRFLLVGFLPTLVLMVLILGLLAAEALVTPNLRALTTRLGQLGFMNIALLLAAALLVSLILYPFQLSMVRILEGYAWETTRFGDALSAVGVELQRRRLERLQNVAYRTAITPDEKRRQRVALSRLAAFPSDPERLLPTRLGNALRAAEDRAGQRYGLDTNTMMPRLYPYLSTTLTEALTDQRNHLDIAVRLHITLLLGTLISGSMLAGDGWWITVPIATAVLAWVAYRAAVQAAVSYGRMLYVAFDLHRFDMLQGLHYPLPDRTTEVAFNEDLSAFLRGEIDTLPTRYPYEHPDQTQGPRSWRSCGCYCIHSVG
jgi:hypothetical protein